MSKMFVVSGRTIVEGEATAKLLVIKEPISFYGEVDASTGVYRDGRSMRNRIVIAPGVRGSTVGAYIIYAMKKCGVAPKALVLGNIDPVVVVGCVLTSIPLIIVDSVKLKHILESISDECIGEVKALSMSSATLKIVC
ncbi:MAG TPA: DUF126 domain-containing protein [Pyrodictiaceae archaeon]|nr:DUF126 domain-containing protein [Pyrodictiaceae archaeon]HIQ10941.1 DUF126 domain-containing protein [Pyrodictium sp.]HIQ56273.1 DUF126 domain-containing protein [Pyrodictium sp.]